MLLSPLRLLSAVTVLASLATLASAATFEPPGNQVLFGGWIDTMAGYEDTPLLFNNRIGHYTPVFQIAQDIPLPAYNYTTGAGGAALENLIELSKTDAAVFLTVYPASGFAAVAESDFTALGNQILAYQQTYNRTVFLRYAPEMQGTWNLYGFQPTEFNTSWHAMYAAVKAVAPDTLMVWAPNTPQGYPYGQATTSLSAADLAALDTNGDGSVTVADDAFAPFYPGDDVVDWIGLSVYYKGLDNDYTNEAQPGGYCGLVINGTNPEGMTDITNWYQTYCAAKPTKACMFAESGAAWHVNDTGSATQLSLQQAWIDDCITNTTFLDAFPRLKLIMQFEYEKVESDNEGDDDLRDYRITNVTDVLNYFTSQLALPEYTTRFSWANSRAVPTSVSSVGAAPPATNSAGSTIVEVITQTTRARPTTFPALFGSTSDGSLRAQVIELGVLAASGIAGAVVVMRLL